MKLLVGTLYSGENEFDECLRGIRSQTWTDFEHFVVRDLPNREAHQTLYRRFMRDAQRFNLFLKVDADMVIENKDLFAEIVNVFRSQPRLKLLEIAVQDFFSDRLMWGLNAYRNCVTWPDDGENLFVDYTPISRADRWKDENNLAPAAIHCKNPSPFHAFHFGVHRALKVIQFGRPQVVRVESRDQWLTVQAVRAKFERTRDRRIGFAALGAELGLSGGLRPEHVDYSSPALRRLFERYEHADTQTLDRRIRRASWRTFGWLPSEARYRCLMAAHRWRGSLARTYREAGPIRFAPRLAEKACRRAGYAFRARRLE